MNELFERKTEDLIKNTPIELFTLSHGGKDRKFAVRLRTAATVDEWLAAADAVVETGDDVDYIASLMARASQHYMRDRAKLTERALQTEVPNSQPEPAAEEITEEQVAETRARYHDLRGRWRKKAREYLDAMLECVCDYDLAQLDPALLRKMGVTDDQVITAFVRLRVLSDPLRRAQIVFAQSGLAGQ